MTVNIVNFYSPDIINTSTSLEKYLEQEIKILNYYKHRGFSNWIYLSDLDIVMPEKVTESSLCYNYALRLGECKLIAAKYKASEHRSF